MSWRYGKELSYVVLYSSVLFHVHCRDWWIFMTLLWWTMTSHQPCPTLHPPSHFNPPELSPAPCPSVRLGFLSPCLSSLLSLSLLSFSIYFYLSFFPIQSLSKVASALIYSCLSGLFQNALQLSQVFIKAVPIVKGLYTRKRGRKLNGRSLLQRCGCPWRNHIKQAS